VPTQYDDGGFSGATLERPALAALVEDIKAGKVDCVVVYKVDRLTLNILLSFTQFECEIIGDRSRDKVAAHKRKGEWTGRRIYWGSLQT
jgi:site-specific DNA recombinase